MRLKMEENSLRILAPSALKRHYNYLSEAPDLGKAGAIYTALINTYPAFEAFTKEPHQISVVQDESNPNNWIALIRISVGDKLCTIGSITFGNLDKEDSYIVFSNNTLKEMALEKKSFEETTEEQLGNKNPQREVLNFLKRCQRVANWCSLDSSYWSDFVYRVDSVRSEKDLSKDSKTILGMSGAALGISIFWGVVGILLLSLAPTLDYQHIYFGTSSLVMGAIFVAMELGVGLAYRLRANEKIKQLDELKSSFQNLSEEAVNILSSSKPDLTCPPEIVLPLSTHVGGNFQYPHVVSQPVHGKNVELEREGSNDSQALNIRCN